jgi:phosphoesterase RecJ-like protein
MATEAHVDVDSALAEAARALSQADEVALACHVNPDPDALGSMLGLSLYLRGRGVRTVCSYGNDPFEKAPWVTALAGADSLVEPRRFPRRPSIMVTLDSASSDRLGQLAPIAARAGTLIWIDHHVSNEGLGTIPVIDPKASSTAELVFRLLKKMGGEIPPDAAACLYAGIVTDTGRFQYEATTPATLELAAELRTYPFDHARLAQVLFEDNTVGYLRVLAVALQRLAFDEEAAMVWTYITQADLAESGLGVGETDDMIDVVRTAREADVAVVLKQQRDGRFKVSMRSRGGADLARVAARFGGGGHRLASGYTSGVGVDETIVQLAAALAEARTPGGARGGSSRPGGNDLRSDGERTPRSGDG